ncbi:MAG: RluA family pseudouridine synthase [Lachnospiraceae bacterium]|nr:RluA family pseudouridine synthase [Lachnospiraceae bacterium]
MATKTFFVDKDDADCRLDRYLSDNLESLSRSYIQKLITDGHVLVGGLPRKSNYRLTGGDIITAQIPDPEPYDVKPENIPLDILYEDEDLIFIDKPKGMVVHPGAGHETGTVVNALLYHCGDSLSGINGIMRPGIVHRIDKDTSGVIVCCKNDRAHRAVAEQLARHSVNRKYFAICNGVIDADGTVDAPIARNRNNRLKMSVSDGGRRAVTHYRVLEVFNKYTHIECCLETGRTHQIRVHMDYIHHPLLGDELYGNIPSAFKTSGQMLHAGVLGLVHPTSGEYLEIISPLPNYFKNILKSLKNR